ncbi:type IV pilus secretin PilQ [Halorhodospira halophila]|uniref:type IV pilus secretin PilQ n=1 Tax=Halorhodospira halophila TaxID=1053 RepID=UPI000673D2FC|nr:type IV pilus secretin PilQ [Halorhodospira halophila]
MLLIALPVFAAPPDPFQGRVDEEGATRPEPALRTLPLVHAEAAQLAELLRDETGVLSESGHASVDERTNTLILQDTPARLEEAEQLVRELDRANRQVMIEARIVLASGEYSRELGSRLGLSSERGDGHFAFDSLPGSNDAAVGDGLLAELPPVGEGARLSVSVGEVGERLLQLELSAMEAEGHGRVVSSPRVLTTERQAARIEQGVQIPYQETAESGATAVAFQDAALSLTATPQVTEDDAVSLALRVTKDAVGQIYEGVPSIDTQAVTTHLRVQAGETIVLGGVREHEQRKQRQRVPWLGELPLIGWLFRQRMSEQSHHELLVFVTPRLVEDGPSSSTAVDDAAPRPHIDSPSRTTEDDW